MKVQGNLSPWLMSVFEISPGWFGHPKTDSSKQNSYHKMFLPQTGLQQVCYAATVIFQKSGPSKGELGCSVDSFLVLCMSPGYLERAPAAERSRGPCLSIMAAAMSFPFYRAVLSLQQAGSVSIPRCVRGAECCITPALRELNACLVVPGAKSEGDSPGLSSGPQLVPRGAQLNKSKR